MDPRHYVVLVRSYPRKGSNDPLAEAEAVQVVDTLDAAKRELAKLCKGPNAIVFRTGRAGRYTKQGQLYRVFIKRRRKYARKG